jgi:K+/H+ antiporter YhaU regulatory subunit KhtT
MQEFIDLIAYDNDNTFSEIALENHQSLWGRPLAEIRKHTELDISVVGIKDNSGYIVNPSSSVLMDKSQQLIIMATHEQITKFKERFA